jgi:hypothetical protein
VDSVNGPAVLYDVKNLVRRDKVSVVHSDGGVSKFVVKIQVPKVEFPTAMVYGPIDHAGLRLITCGGEFNTATGPLPRQHHCLRQARYHLTDVEVPHGVDHPPGRGQRLGGGRVEDDVDFRGIARH